MAPTYSPRTLSAARMKKQAVIIPTTARNSRLDELMRCTSSSPNPLTTAAPGRTTLLSRNASFGPT